MYYIVAYRESGNITQCPFPFANLEDAIFCAELALHHFGPGYTVTVEEEVEDGAE